MEDDPHSPLPSANKLYFPASVYFGNLSVLPGPEEVEYPERDLADKLVGGCVLLDSFVSDSYTSLTGRYVLQTSALPHTRYRQELFSRRI